MSEAKTNTDVEPSEPQPDAGQDTPPQPPQPPQPSEEPPAQQPLRTWITTYDTGTHSARYYQLNLLVGDVHKLITDRTSEEYSLHEALEELNVLQRGYVLNLVSRLGSTLIFVDVWKKERTITVFGKVELAFLVWVTSGGLDDTTDFPMLTPPPPPGPFASPPPPPGYPPVGPPPTVYSQLEGSKAGSETGDEAIDNANDEPGTPAVRLRDAVGRKLLFPYELVKSWKGMHNLITEAFAGIPSTKAYIDRGHYDLLDDSTDDIILPSVWGYFVKPGMEVVMRAWTISGAPPPTIPQLLAPSSGAEYAPLVPTSGRSPPRETSPSSPLPCPPGSNLDSAQVETDEG